MVEETKMISDILADFLSLRAGNSVCRHALRSLRPHRCVCVSVCELRGGVLSSLLHCVAFCGIVLCGVV